MQFLDTFFRRRASLDPKCSAVQLQFGAIRNVVGIQQVVLEEMKSLGCHVFWRLQLEVVVHVSEQCCAQ